MPMPLDVEVTYKDGSKETYYIPLRIMRGEKANESDQKRTVLADWPWTHPDYEFEIKGKEVSAIKIDPSFRMADVDRNNNEYSKE